MVGSLPPPISAKRLIFPNCKDGRKKNMYWEVPGEMVEEILLRLPADSLKNCMLVCKSWFELINDPSFINKHLHRLTTLEKSKSYSRTIFFKWFHKQSSKKDRLTPHFRQNYKNYKLVLSLVTICDDYYDDDGNNDSLPCVIEQVSLPPMEQEDLTRNFNVFHCNGIIHLFDSFCNRISVLLNPALRQFKLLLEPEQLRCPPPPKFMVNCVGCGFGYDPKANLYKYVKIFRDYVKAVSTGSFKDTLYTAWVHTLGMDSWKEVKIDFEGNHHFHLHEEGVYCKGSYYWRSTSSMMGNAILSFDMSDEKFRSIPFPDEQRQTRRENYSLTLEVWKESIVFFYGTNLSWSSTLYEMWVMFEDNSTYNWIKHLKIGPLVGIGVPLAFWKDDELLFSTVDGVVSYNLYTQKLRKVPLPRKLCAGFTYAASCLKTLVSV